MAPTLDHIIILLPYASLVNPPSWITENFTITPGGKHGDGKTENKLICFRDGTYIELIAFIDDDPKKRKGHWWDKEFGIVDFSFAHSDGDATVLFSDLEERLKSLDWEDGAVEVRYTPPQAGARIRPDGQEVKWQVTFPVVTTGYQRGELPFFTHDMTSRSLRVPFSEEIVTHPSLALGVKSLSNFIQASKGSALAKAYSAILGVSNLATEESSPRLGLFEVQGAKEIDGEHKVRIYLKTPKKESQLQQREIKGGSMLGDLVFGVSAVSDASQYPQKLDISDGGIGGVFLDQY
jgi:Glyoxalase-like domain